MNGRWGDTNIQTIKIPQVANEVVFQSTAGHWGGPLSSIPDVLSWELGSSLSSSAITIED